MNELKINNQQTMSSTEIAELTGKQKKHIHQDIKDQLFGNLYDLKDGQDLDHQQIKGITVVLDNRGYWSEVMLDREHTLTLITGYDVKARHTINKRWIELETAQQKPMTQLELIANIATAMVDQEKRTLALESDIKRLEAKITATPDNYYSVAGYYSMIGEPVDASEANRIGRAAVRLSKEMGIPTGKCHSAVYSTSTHIMLMCYHSFDVKREDYV